MTGASDGCGPPPPYPPHKGEGESVARAEPQVSLPLVGRVPAGGWGWATNAGLTGIPAC